MPIQVDTPEKSSKLVPAVVLAVLIGLGIIIATNWRALILVLILLAAAAGYWLAKPDQTQVVSVDAARGEEYFIK